MPICQSRVMVLKNISIHIIIIVWICNSIHEAEEEEPRSKGALRQHWPKVHTYIYSAKILSQLSLGSLFALCSLSALFLEEMTTGFHFVEERKHCTGRVVACYTMIYNENAWHKHVLVRKISVSSCLVPFRSQHFPIWKRWSIFRLWPFHLLFVCLLPLTTKAKTNNIVKP